MDLTYLIYLSSGLFLGWSLGANDASNVFGTAVGSKMVRFSTMALISSVFIIIGAVYGGEGTSETLGELGKVDTIAGSFMAALSAAISIYWMSKAGISVSTSQAIVGGIIGWNLYSGNPTSTETLLKICSTWTLCPVISGVFAVVLYYLVKKTLKCSCIHLLMQDQITRIGLIVTAAFCAYALGANNIANVVGVFIKSCPFKPLNITEYLTLSPQQVLFLLGAISISVGIFTYSHKVIKTIGNSLMKITPVIAWIVVLAQALVLILFSSTSLHNWLIAHSLPTIPLVPVSSTQAVIGAILGIGLAKGGRGINWSIAGKIIVGWIASPVLALLICYISLFFLENVFNQTVYIAS